MTCRQARTLMELYPDPRRASKIDRIAVSIHLRGCFHCGEWLAKHRGKVTEQARLECAKLAEKDIGMDRVSKPKKLPESS